MLSRQTHLHTLHVGEAWELRRLVECLRGEAGTRQWKFLRELVLWWHTDRASADAVRDLGAWLRQGGCPALEKLDTCDTPLHPGTASHLCQGLEGCPELQRLALDYLEDQDAVDLAHALERGLWPKLQALSLSKYHSGIGDDRALARALRVSPRPALRELRLKLMAIGEDLGEALGSGACRGLQALGLTNFELEEGAANALARALGAGACPNLTMLETIDTILGPGGAAYLCQGLEACPELQRLQVYACDAMAAVAALERGSWPKLQSLLVESDGDEGVKTLMRALGAFPRPALRELHMLNTPVPGTLVDALRSGACRGLQQLGIAECGVSEEVALALAEALGQGACPDVTDLDLYRIRLTPRVAQALSRAIQGGGLARLHTLELGRNALRDKGVVALGEALRAGGCPRLRHLGLTYVKMGEEGCRGLAQAIRDGGLPSLETLVVYNNTFGYDAEVALFRAATEAGVEMVNPVTVIFNDEYDVYDDFEDDEDDDGDDDEDDDDYDDDVDALS
jgi:hypothetical protein